jgi:hypothetical protein
MVEAAGVEADELLTLRQPAPEISEACATGGAASCHGVADPCNGSLQAVAPGDSVADGLDRARAAWICSRDSRRLRRDLLRLLAELED